MTHKEYVEYEKRVTKFIAREQIDCLSTDTASAIDPTDNNVDPWFSGRSCDCCKSGLAGNREYLHARRTSSDALQQYEICEDCVYYINYGKLDDTTMAEMK